MPVAGAERLGGLASSIAARPRSTLAAIVVASSVVRAAVGLWRPTPLIYPDEYVYTALARSIASNGLPHIRGVYPHFPALVVPYLMSPAWLVSNVETAYHLSLAWGSIWFSLAAIPAYLLARRVGLGTPGALFVGLMTLLVPDAAYTTDALTEPYAYPAFLAATLVALDTLARPTAKRQLALVVVMVLLCLVRVQFIVVPVAYLLAAIAHSGFSPRRVARRQPIVAGAIVSAAVTVLVLGTGRLAGYYANGSETHYTVGGLLRWLGADLFVLAIAAGWVILPGIVEGGLRLARGTGVQRAFVYLSASLTAAVAAVGARFGVSQGRVYERYLFYVVPLLLIAFISAVESTPRNRRYALVAYASAALAIAVPATNTIRGASNDMSPTLLGLEKIGGAGSASTLIWAAALALLAALIGLRAGGRFTAPLLALVVVFVVGTAGARALLTYGAGPETRGVPRLPAPSGTAIVTSRLTDEHRLMKTLFWNPRITRVLVLGGGHAVDGFASANVHFSSEGAIVDPRGNPIPGPYAFDSDTLAAISSQPSEVLRATPRLIVFGWGDDGYLETTSQLYAVAGRRPTEVRFALTSPNGTKTMSVACGGEAKLVRVGHEPTPVQLRAPRGRELSCRISLVKGLPVPLGNRAVSVHARLISVGSRASSKSEA